jgi:hypothetical protein
MTTRRAVLRSTEVLRGPVGDVRCPTVAPPFVRVNRPGASPPVPAAMIDSRV